MLELLSESRNESFDHILKLKNKFGSEVDEVYVKSKLKQEELIRDLQMERHLLSSLLIKQKNFAIFKQFKSSFDFNKKLHQVTEESNKIKRSEVNNGIFCEQRLVLLEQQKAALKKQLAKQDSEFGSLISKLEIEVIQLLFDSFDSF